MDSFGKRVTELGMYFEAIDKKNKEVNTKDET